MCGSDQGRHVEIAAPAVRTLADREIGVLAVHSDDHCDEVIGRSA